MVTAVGVCINFSLGGRLVGFCIVMRVGLKIWTSLFYHWIDEVHVKGEGLTNQALHIYCVVILLVSVDQPGL
ncbi:hypothetical protein SUGI_1028430 [Cryptomeria japonica]|nr:hypothetical protein SUGI_1028430 [Cryptomeria japonica]